MLFKLHANNNVFIFLYIFIMINYTGLKRRLESREIIHYLHSIIEYMFLFQDSLLIII